MADVEDPEKTGETRKDRPTGSMHVGDVDFDPEDPAYEMDASWGEVCQACCVHSPEEWAFIFGGIVTVAFFLYFFLVGLDFLGTGAKVMSGCAAGAFFGEDTNPIAGLMIGILATVLLQSSSTTTSLIVSLVPDVIEVKQGIYMIMGANIGTSVTNTIVAMGHLGDGDQLERAFAGATVHDMFNFMSVAILLPLEVISAYLFHLTKALVDGFTANEGEKWEGPVKKWVEPIGKKVIIENKKVTAAIAAGDKECEEFYPTSCEDPSNPTKETCSRGLIDCDKKTGKCPAFFQVGAERSDDVTSGVVVFIIGLAILFICLFGLVTVLQKLLLGTSTRIIYKATNVNGYVAMLIGAGLTMLVQSSSITTSALTPLVGVGVLRLEQMFPLTLGANIGTTLTGLLAALLKNAKSLQVALAHLFFNISGIIIWYPIPFMRQIPLHAARQLGRATRIWKGFPLIYIGTLFFAVPLMFLGISYLFTQDSTGLTTLGSFIVVVLFFLICWTVYYCQFQGGKQKCYDCLVAREARRETMETLPDDMAFLKKKIQELSEHTGLPADDEAPAAEEEPKTDTAAAQETEEEAA